MRLHCRAIIRAVLAVSLVAPARAAQDSAGTAAQGQSGAESPSKKSSAASTSASKTKSRAKTKTRRYASEGTTSGALSSSSSPSVTAAKSESATFGAGCFWHVEDTFERLKGVKNAVSGYSGGAIAYPSYEMVHTGQTGHAEVVQVEYDPNVISYEDLLNVFWRCHDPTSINRQGEDEGPQYRSVIFYHSEDQRKAALKSYEELTKARVFRSPIVTQLVPIQAFYPAEDYHQNYYSGLRRPPARRRRTVVPSVKRAQTKPKSTASSTAKQPQSTAAPKGGSQ